MKGKGEADVHSCPSTHNSVLFHDCRMGYLDGFWACNCWRIEFVPYSISLAAF